MSYDLNFDCGPLLNPHGLKGGTYGLGTREPELNIPYNYAAFFKKYLGDGGVRTLYGLTAREVVAKLDDVLPQMKGTPARDYWDATEGNAKEALKNLRMLASLCPEHSKLHGD